MVDNDASSLASVQGTLDEVLERLKAIQTLLETELSNEPRRPGTFGDTNE
ncbi:MAG TPA: hypothetical protein VGC18_07170 [Lacisediminihabitans sp.]